MTNKANEGSADKTNYNSLNNEDSEIRDKKSDLPKNQAFSERKSALSKREIMEELSRQRFPWDD